MIRRALAVFLALLVLSGPALAVLPDEMLKDPALEARARALSAQLRCLQCQNQTIDDSNAEIARDIRLVVRERLVLGDSDGAVLDFVAGRYGEFVLLEPRFSLYTALLWLAPGAFLAIGLVSVVVFYRNRRNRVAEPPLSDGEKAALDALMRDD
jgi:cytochrome c-type biogenesis protein CcmH